MTFEEILDSLSPELRARLREPVSRGPSDTRIVELARKKSVAPLELPDLSVLNPITGGDWMAAFGDPLLLRGLSPFALTSLTLAYEPSIAALASADFTLTAKRPLELPGIGAYPSLEVGCTISFPLGGGERRVLATAGGKLDIGGLLFDAPIELPAFKIYASAERGRVDFGRLKQLPVMTGLTLTQAASTKARLTDVFVEIRLHGAAGALVCTVDSVGASNARGDEETWSRSHTEPA